MCGGEVMDDGRCSRCMAYVGYGYGRSRREIRVEGTNHEEVSQVIRELSQEQKSHGLFHLLTHWSFIFGSLLSILGVVLVVVGATGDTEFNLFGQSFKSANVGVAALFIGAVLVILNVRRLLSSYDKTSKNA